MIEKYKLDTGERTELSIDKLVEKTKELDSQIVPHRGHRMFEINEETGEIWEARYIEKTAFIFGKENRKEILMRTGFFYTSALNKKNALTNWKLRKNGSKKMGDLKMEFY